LALLVRGALQFRREDRRPEHLDPDEIRARSDELNQAAERYYTEFPDPEFLLSKPFSEPDTFARRLFDLGVLFHALRLSPRDVVLELGAGACWVSHFLNRYGCKTYSVDVSETGLRLGRERFERESGTRWDLEPEFVVYDGYRMPLPDGCCDKIVINDAFHHFPNPGEILEEMARVLTVGGVVAMSEPGPGHSEVEHTRREVENTGVLENEVILEELDEMARAAGFTSVTLVPLALPELREVPVGRLGGIEEVEAHLDQWLATGRENRYVVLHKGRWMPNTLRPERLDARIEILAPQGGTEVAAGSACPLRVRVANRGDTRWLATITERPGWARLGVHLYRTTGDGAEEPPGELVDFDWLRVSLPFDMEPGDEATVEVELPPIAEPGAYRLVFDLVAEGVLWFAQKGSPTTELALEVGGGDA